jgi:hypothetical protein
MKEDEKGGICNTVGVVGINAYNILVRKPERKGRPEDLGEK